MTAKLLQFVDWQLMLGSLGTIFMDLDALSGVVAYRHTGESVMTVTAAIDRITIKHPLDDICDLELSGQVTFATGRSSMEISMQVAKAPTEGGHITDEDVLMTCAFTMVSLDPSSKKYVPASSCQAHALIQQTCRCSSTLSRKPRREAHLCPWKAELRQQESIGRDGAAATNP